MSLKAEAHKLEPLVRIGKNGLTEQQVAEIKRQLNKKKLLKIKILKAVSDKRKEIKDELLRQTGAELISAVGNVIVLHKKI